MAITTGKVRASYVNIFQPRIPENGGEPKYSVTLLIPKTDAATLNAIFAEIERAKQEGVQKFNGSIPPMCKTPIYDGDGYRPSGEAFGEECRGCMVMTASAKNQPVVVDLNMQNIINPADIYSGCYIRASINFFAYKNSGNKGIGCGLNAVQKIEDGEPLVMRISAEEAFGGSNAYAGMPTQNAGANIYAGMPIQWDGAPRVDTLLADYFGAEDNLYTREAIRKTLVGAVARVLSPGIKFDTMLILSGRQGIGKSTFFRYLGMDWYSDSLCTFEGKDAAELLQGYWLIEAGELTGLTKSEMNSVKQFLSKCDDVYRAAYGRRTEKHLRQCIIVGTTNETEFLKDYTGNRRFWPVDLGLHPHRKNIWKDMPAEVPQIWAEAVMMYRLGEPLILSAEAEKMAEGVQDEHRETSYSEGVIVEFLEKKVPYDWYKKSLYERRNWLDSEFNQKQAAEGQLMYRDRICAFEIWTECFKMPGYSRMKKSDSKEINSILERLPGWERQKGVIRFGGEYGSQRGFIRCSN